MGEEKGGGWNGRRVGESASDPPRRRVPAEVAAVRKFGEDEPDRETVRDAVANAFPYPNDVLRLMRWDAVDGCWFIKRNGMTIGIETDGYIHS